MSHRMPTARRGDRTGCAAPRLEVSRNIAAPAVFSSITLTGAALIAVTIDGAPPEKAKMPPTGQTMSGSVNRTERIGPTTSVVRDWNIASSRVI